VSIFHSKRLPVISARLR